MTASGDRPAAQWCWRAAVLLSAAAPLLVGFEMSAVANRLVFALWGLVAAAVLLIVLRRAWARSRLSAAARLAITASGALGVLTLLVRRHAEAVDTGMRAFAVKVPPATVAPPTLALLALLALAAAVTLAAADRRASSRQ